MTLASGVHFTLSTFVCCFVSDKVLVVLETIKEKVNNPSADDPFEPEIAAVRLIRLPLCHKPSRDTLSTGAEK